MGDETSGAVCYSLSPLLRLRELMQRAFQEAQFFWAVEEKLLVGITRLYLLLGDRL